jgi:O-antigen/teichoic acid export membrane protein
MTQASKITSSTLWQLASQFCMAMMSVLVVKFVATGLTQELAGIYNSAYGYLQLFGIMADFGIYAVAVRELSTARNKSEILSALFVIRLMLTVLALGSAVLIGFIIPSWQGTPLPIAVSIAALVPAFVLMSGVLRTVFQVHYKLQWVFAAEVLQRILTLCLIGGTVYLLNGQSNNPMVVYLFLGFGVLGSVLLFAISLIGAVRYQKISFIAQKSVIPKLLKQALPFGLAYICIALYRQLDLTLISLWRPDFQIQNAYYGFVVRLAESAFLIPTLLLNSTLPLLQNLQDKKQRLLLGNTFLTIVSITGVCAMGSFLWAKPLILLLTTPQYLATIYAPGSDTALQYLSPTLFFNGIILYGFYVLLSKKQWQSLVIILLFGAGLSLGSNMTLIPSLGFMGAVYTALIVQCILAVVIGSLVMYKYPVTLTRQAILRTIAVLTAFLALLWLLQPVLYNEWFTLAGLGILGVVALGFIITLKKQH